jgi:hypothetical protein
MADSYTIPLGRTLYVDATLWNFSQPAYLWQCEGVTSTDEIFSFTPTAEGDYSFSLTVSDADGYSLSRTISVHCAPAEGKFRRAITQQSIATASKVYAYRPAAGQFINEPQSGFAGEATVEAATAYAEHRLAENKYLSLGAWGGYVVVGFDHFLVSRLHLCGNIGCLIVNNGSFISISRCIRSFTTVITAVAAAAHKADSHNQHQQ